MFRLKYEHLDTDKEISEETEENGVVVVKDYAKWKCDEGSDREEGELSGSSEESSGEEETRRSYRKKQRRTSSDYTTCDSEDSIDELFVEVKQEVEEGEILNDGKDEKEMLLFDYRKSSDNKRQRVSL